jgi:hypothetical protein
MAPLEAKKMMAWRSLFWEAQATLVDAGLENCDDNFVASSRSAVASDHFY